MANDLKDGKPEGHDLHCHHARDEPSPIVSIMGQHSEICSLTRKKESNTWSGAQSYWSIYLSTIAVSPED